MLLNNCFLLLLLLLNVSLDGFQIIHIQAGMMRWCRLEKIDVRFWFIHVTGIPSCPYQCQLLSLELQSCNLVCWGFFLVKITSSITDNLLCAPLPGIPMAGYTSLGAGTRGSPGQGWGLSLLRSRRLLLGLWLLRLRFRRDEALHLLRADGHFVRLQPALQVLQRAGDSKGTP